MSNAFNLNGKNEVARPLKILVPLIRTEIEAGNSAGIEHYRRAGEMLLEAKAQVGPRGWVEWVRRNFKGLSRATSYAYMKLAEETAGRSVRDLTGKTMTSILDPDQSRPRAQAWHDPVKKVMQSVDLSALKRERQNRIEEAKMVRNLALQLINIGYRALAAKLHPDKPGGSTEAMSRLNKVKALLQGAL